MYFLVKEGMKKFPRGLLIMYDKKKKINLLENRNINLNLSKGTTSFLSPHLKPSFGRKKERLKAKIAVQCRVMVSNMSL